MDSTIIYITAFVSLVAVAVATSIIVVRRDGRNVGDLIKQLLVWLCIASLLPLTSYAGAAMLHPQAKMKDLMAEQVRVQSETQREDDKAARDALYERYEALREQVEDERRATYQAMFWVSFPIGFVTLLAGFFIRVVPVGTGLAFGGLCTLVAGCYSYWNDMGDALRFFSLLVVLVTVTALGLLKFRRPAAGVGYA